MIKDVKGTSPAQLNRDLEKFKRMCNCLKCLTHATWSGMQKSRFSDLVVKEFHMHFRAEGLYLSDLPAHHGVWLKHNSFSMKGAEKAQRYEMRYGEQKITDLSFFSDDK